MSEQEIPVEAQDLDQALGQARRLLEEDPRAALAQAETLVRVHLDPRVYRLAAEACRKLGMHDDSVSAELAGIQAGLSNRELERAAIAQSEGRSGDALDIAEECLRREPDDLLAMTIAAEAAMSLWQLERAETLLRTVLRRAPTFLRVSILLASCLTKQTRPRDAIAVLEEVIARKPNNVAALAQLAQLRVEVGDVDRAFPLQEKLVSVEPAGPKPRVDLAQIYSIAGRRSAAIETLRQALQMDPSIGGAWWSLTNYFPDEITESDQQAMRDALSRDTGTLDGGALHLALGLIADRAGSHEDAFVHFRTGKQICLAAQPYDPAPITAVIDHMIETFTPDFYERRSRSGWANASPIFILGMPRSGSTMVERMLGRHSAIEAAGELPILARLAEGARRRADSANYAVLLDTISDADVARLGEHYVRASGDYRRTEKPRFIDKNNLNWLQVGLILVALPDAKIIDLRRNALDCCWANFKMLFAGGFPAANHLGHIGQFYRDYVRLFDAMDRAAPGRILPMRYEEVVDDSEEAVRRMLDFLDLPFEADCLDFHLSTDPVATASSEQVRRPLNREGIGSAEPYREWLGPLIEELGPLAEA
jgi:tetratricopeptide (TPR) repeat protein